MRILKTTVKVNDDVQTLKGVRHTEQVVHVACQHSDEEVTVWFKEDNRLYVREPDDLHALVVGTGHEWPRDAEYLGTAITRNGWLVWHLLRVQS